MDDSFFMCVFQRFGNLACNGQSLIQRYRTLSDEIGQRRALCQLHNQRMLTVAFFQPIDSGDVGVVKRSQQLGFPPEAAGIFVSAQMLGTVVLGTQHGLELVVLLASLLHPRVVVFGGLLSQRECEALMAAARELSNRVEPPVWNDDYRPLWEPDDDHPQRRR